MQRVVSREGIHGQSPHSFSPEKDSKEGKALTESPLSVDESKTITSRLASVNIVENFSADDRMNTDDQITASVSESSMAGGEIDQPTERLSNVPPATSTSNRDGNTAQRTFAVETDDTGSQQPQQSPLSIISGLLPNVALMPLSRLDSRNSGTMSSLGSGLPRSQNSSRDWGWFEDVHHSDQSVTGGGETRKTGNNGKRTTKGSTVSSVGVKEHDSTSAGMRKLHRGTNANGLIDGSNADPTTRDASGSQHHNSLRVSADRNDTDRRGRRNSGTKRTNTSSLVPMGEGMLIDDMQEYLEPIVIHNRTRDMENDPAVQAVTAPNYVLEESLSDQLLWRKTAGNRPPQPVEERAFFEAQWAENFANSEVKYEMPTEVLTATTPISLNPFAETNFGTGIIGAGTPSSAGAANGNNRHVADMVSSFVVPGGMGAGGNGMSSSQQNTLQSQQAPRVVRCSSGNGGKLTVYFKGDNVFGTTVSKSFPRPSVNGELVSGVDTVNISVASYRVVESENRGKHAQFLVIYREGSIRDTIGVWKRYSDFQELSKKVTKVHEGCASVIANMSPLAMTEEHDVEHLPNAITSWHLLKKRKRWYRCLDSGYLSLKAFLLERFLHDILFESSTPDLLRDFVGVPPMM